ncbi:hypothetical protein [Amycolatopsis sp. RTGN1]|uniref:hypothetical protein n=1 Tax=Amycolatopsis ponsaeliensis TaxID=2992142 RepID=UPI00254CDEF8|nr:hypothetical protein [Amycolatopsis sp. RTGN1]
MAHARDPELDGVRHAARERREAGVVPHMVADQAAATTATARSIAAPDSRAER